MFKKITAQVGTITTLELQYVSPKLLAARDLELAVPGCFIIFYNNLQNFFIYKFPNCS